ncbi:MAG: hypothetical protein ACD_2C00246G0003 [uncultured bacterium (gcode 4)]|uniref:Uncharacterized protein n=1 Tax=uncultured bacterium (gcode 4) TaxID=1234023 RepID=K2FD27_9BACT|nr:MAG: hypothetical protein ACD_2C00246G0003 [uncultured bacterium (gcode 4)]
MKIPPENMPVRMNNAFEAYPSIEKALYLLEWDWAVGFRNLYELLKDDFASLSPTIIDRLRSWVIGKIQYLLRCWSWNDLKWCEDVLRMFSIEDIWFSPEMIAFIEEYLPRCSYKMLERMVPSWLSYTKGKFYIRSDIPKAYFEKYWREFHQTEYTRTILLEFSFTPEELTESFIIRLTEMRNVFYRIYKSPKSLTETLNFIKKGVKWILEIS